MLAITVKADQTELYNILRTLLHYYIDAEEIDLRHSVPVWEQVEKYDLAEPFGDSSRKLLAIPRNRPVLRIL